MPRPRLQLSQSPGVPGNSQGMGRKELSKNSLGAGLILEVTQLPLMSSLEGMHLGIYAILQKVTC